MKLTQTLINRLPSVYSVLPASLIASEKGRAIGPDLSHWKDYYDPEGAPNQADFAITKATEGTTYVDPALDPIWNGVKKLPIRGLFHYQRSGMSWKAQADHFLHYAARYDAHILALDVEKINNTTDARFFQDSFRMIKYLQEQAAPIKTIKVMLYTNKDIFQNYLFPVWKRDFGREGEELALTVPFWYAQYWTLWSPDKEPSMPTQRSTWDIWQITARADPAEWGAGSLSLDLNVYNGSAVTMRAWLGIDEAQPEPEPEPQPVPTPPPSYPDEPEPEPETWRATVISGVRVRVRDYPEVAEWNLTSQYVTQGQTFQGRLWAGNGFVWMKITDQEFPLQGKWVAVRSLDASMKLITLQRVLPAEPEPAPIPNPDTYTYYQALHDFELPDKYIDEDYSQTKRIRLAAFETSNAGVPEVFRLEQFHFTNLTEPLQRLWFGLNPGMTLNAWGALTNGTLAFTNDHGTDQFRDYIRGQNMNKGLPKIATLICGGDVYTGVEVGNMLRVNTIIPSIRIPTPEEARARRLCFRATIIQKDGEVIRFPQMRNVIPPDVWIPLISSFPVYYPLDKLRRLPAGTDPNKVDPYVFK